MSGAANGAKGHGLVFEVVGGEPLMLSRFTGMVAGYTGRDEAAVQHHIDELAEIGVAPPPQVPMFYPMPMERFSNGGHHTESGCGLTSGEVEPVYVRHGGHYYLGIGSDHTDRDLETEDVGAAKRACVKPVGRSVVAIDDLDSFLLDETIARCWVDGTLYQEGPLSGLRTPADVVGRLLEHQALGDGDFICFGGTLPLLAEGFRAGTQWRLRFDLPGGQHLQHDYTIEKG